MKGSVKVLVLVAAGVAALGSGAAVLGSTARHAATRAAAGSQTFTVDVDGRNPKANEAFLAYFPNVVRLHAGDTVVFHMVGNGEPHTVTLGSLTNAAVEAFDKLTPQQQHNPPASAIAADAAVPQLLPQGPGDAVQSSANPCFVQTGGPGTSICPNSQHEQPAFDGTQTFYNSGWLNSDQRFTVHISGGTAPGTYRFMCLLHREDMSGRLVVEPSGTAVPSPSAQFAAGQAKLASWEAQLDAAVTAERQGQLQAPAQAPSGTIVLAGSGSPTSPAPAEITEFGPKTIKIPVGGSVTWYLLGPHSITFNSTAANDDIRAKAPDGSVHLNPAALAPAGGPGEPPKPPSGGSPTKPKFAVVASSSWNGQGFHNSGVFVNSFGPPLIEGYKLTFTRAGTYHYICTVHDRMKGTVVVGG
jgi:plastocyanin